MSDRVHISPSNLQASQDLDIAIIELLSGLSEDLSIKTRDYVCSLITRATAKVPIENIWRMKYDFLVLNNHIKPFTPEQIASAVTAHKNKASSESENRAVLTD